MAVTADRTSYFPLIEKRYGRPMSFWHEEMTKVADKKYPEQMAFLRNEHGFSRPHANALVQYSRGSHSSRRYESVDDYLAEHDDDKQQKLQAILTTIAEEFPESSVVIAWNHPMVMIDGQNVFGVSAHSKHLLLAPFGDGVIDQFRERLGDYELNKKTVKVPIDWQVDRALIRDMIDVHRS